MSFRAYLPHKLSDLFSDEYCTDCTKHNSLKDILARNHYVRDLMGVTHHSYKLPAATAAAAKSVTHPIHPELDKMYGVHDGFPTYWQCKRGCSVETQ